MLSDSATPDEHQIANEQLAVTVHAVGAELRSVYNARFGEMLWQAEPAWPQHAPNLFPIVGQLAGDRLRANGQVYTLTRHGFARREPFAWTARTPTGCTLVLSDNATTRALYPFAFRLEIDYSLAGDTLTVKYTLHNPGNAVLPASLGAHPAFRWPLVAGIAKTAHVVEFAEAEPAPIRRLIDGLLKLESFDSPVAGRVLKLDEELFVADAIIMDQLISRSVRYSAPGAPVIDVAWDGFRELGLWSKGDAAFLCIEPWYGYASPADFDGPFEQKPGLAHIAQGSEQTFTLRIRIGE